MPLSGVFAFTRVAAELYGVVGLLKSCCRGWAPAGAASVSAVAAIPKQTSEPARMCDVLVSIGCFLGQQVGAKALLTGPSARRGDTLPGVAWTHGIFASERENPQRQK